MVASRCTSGVQAGAGAGREDVDAEVDQECEDADGEGDGEIDGPMHTVGSCEEDYGVDGAVRDLDLMLRSTTEEHLRAVQGQKGR